MSESAAPRPAQATSKGAEDATSGPGIVVDTGRPDYRIASDVTLEADGSWKHNARISLAPVPKDLQANIMAVTVDNTAYRHLGVFAAFIDDAGVAVDLDDLVWRDKAGNELAFDRANFVTEYGGTSVLLGNGTWEQTNDRGVSWGVRTAELDGESAFDTSTFLFLGFLAPPPSLLGLPIASTTCSAATGASGNCIISSSATFLVPSPTNTARIQIILTSPGHGSALGDAFTNEALAAITTPAWVMTGVFEYILPTMFLAIGATINSSVELREFSQSQGTKIASKFAEKFPKFAQKVVPIVGKSVETIVADGAAAGVKAATKSFVKLPATGFGQAMKSSYSGTSGGADTSQTGGAIDTLASLGFSALEIAITLGVGTIITKASATAAANKIPIVGTASTAINVACWAAQILWTTTGIILSEQTFGCQASRVYTLRVRLFPDRGDPAAGRLPSPSFPQVIYGNQGLMGPGVVYVRLSGRGDFRTRDVAGSRGQTGLWLKDEDFQKLTHLGELILDGEYPQEYALLTFEGIPRGAVVTLSVSLQTADGWIAAQAHQIVQVMPWNEDNRPAYFHSYEAETETITVDLAVTQCLIPITADTRYNHLGKTVGIEGAFAWDYSTVPTAVTAGEERALAGTPGFIALNRPTAQAGFTWKAANPALLGCGTGTSGGVYDQVFNAAIPPTGFASGVSSIGCGMQTDLHLSYETEGPPDGLHFVVWKIPSAHPLTGLPFHEVRKLDLSVHTLGADGCVEGCAQLSDIGSLPLWGTLFSDSIRKIVSHKAGFLVALHANGVRIEILNLTAMLATPPSEEVPRGRLIAGPAAAGASASPGGSELTPVADHPPTSGRLSRAVSVAAAPTGRVFVVLDAGAKCLQAFDDSGHPVVDYFETKNAAGDTVVSTSEFLMLEAEPAGATATYLDVSVEWNDLVYVLLHRGSGSSASEYSLDVYDRRSAKRISRTDGVLAASIVVDYWRSVYALNLEAIDLNVSGIGMAPQVSVWTPSTPDCEALILENKPAPGCAVDPTTGLPTGDANPPGGCG